MFLCNFGSKLHKRLNEIIIKSVYYLNWLFVGYHLDESRVYANIILAVKTNCCGHRKMSMNRTLL